MKGFYESKFPYVLNVEVFFEDGSSFEDAIKGLNHGHALYLAKNNWPCAFHIEPIE